MDENAAFLIGELRALGVDLRRITVIPDDRDDIAQTVTACAARVDHVFTSAASGRRTTTRVAVISSPHG